MSENPSVNSLPEEKKDELTEKDLEGVSGGAFDAYLNLDGIKGESTDDKPQGWIEVNSFSKGG